MRAHTHTHTPTKPQLQLTPIWCPPLSTQSGKNLLIGQSSRRPLSFYHLLITPHEKKHTRSTASVRDACGLEQAGCRWAKKKKGGWGRKKVSSAEEQRIHSDKVRDERNRTLDGLQETCYTEGGRPSAAKSPVKSSAV